MRETSTKQTRRSTRHSRLSPLRLFHWVDSFESDAARHTCKVLLGALSLGALTGLLSLLWKCRPFLIDGSIWFLRLLRSQMQLELWHLLLCIVVPCVVPFVWLLLLKRKARLIVVHSAVWHTDDQHQEEVTDFFRHRAKAGCFCIPISIKLLGDPHRGKRKTLTIDYSIGRKRKTKILKEHEDKTFDFYT